MVWKVDTVLWLVVQITQYLSVPPFSGALSPGISLPPSTDPFSYSTSAEYGWPTVDPLGRSLCKDGT